MKSTSRVHGQSLALVGSLFLASCGSSGPATPTITSATAAIDSITVTWTSVPGSASYNVYDALTGVPSSSNSIDSNSTNSPTTSLTFALSSLGVPLVIAVTAVDPNGNESNDSGTRTIATLVPTAVAVVDQVSGTKNLLVSWDAVSGRGLVQCLRHQERDLGWACADGEWGRHECGGARNVGRLGCRHCRRLLHVRRNGGQRGG